VNLLTSEPGAGRRRPQHPDLVSHRTPTHPDVIVGRANVSAVKVWQPWIRTLHWTLVATVAVLSMTGFYIGNPVLDAGPRWSLMSLARTTHLIASWVFIAVLIGRVFLAFTGNLGPAGISWFPGTPSVAGSCTTPCGTTYSWRRSRLR
jgi:hypothetical protein